MATKKSATRTAEERDRRFDQIMSCPYDDLKTNLSDTVDALLALRSERERKQRIDDFINTLSDGVYRIEKNRLPE